jgi:Flp pilus assembly secretin CpaC
MARTALRVVVGVAFVVALSFAARPSPAVAEDAAPRKPGAPSAAQIKDMLKSIPNLTVTQAGAAVVIDGTVSTPMAKERVDLIAASFDGVVSLVTLDEGPDANDILVREIAKKIGLPGLVVKLVRGYVVLEGEAANEGDRKSAENVARTFSDKVVNNIGLKTDMVEVDVAFVDMLLVKSLSISGPVLGGAALGSWHQESPPLGPVGAALARAGQRYAWSAALNTTWLFEAIEADRNSKILNRPHLTTLSRQPAHFWQGGEKGYEVKSSQVANVVWKPWGLDLKVTPELTRDGRVNVVMSFEVSSPAGGFDFLTHKTEATALLAPGQSLVVAGLVQDIQSNMKKGIPFLMRIPLLGHLFTGHEDQKDKRDLMVIITPRVAAPLPGTSESFAKEQTDRMAPLQLRWVEQLNRDDRDWPPMKAQYNTPEQKLLMEMKDREEQAPAAPKPKAEGEQEEAPVQPAAAPEPEPQAEAPVEPQASSPVELQASAPVEEPKAEIATVPEPTIQASKD